MISPENFAPPGVLPPVALGAAGAEVVCARLGAADVVATGEPTAGFVVATVSAGDEEPAIFSVGVACVEVIAEVNIDSKPCVVIGTGWTVTV